MFRKLFLSILVAVGLAVGLTSPAQATDSSANVCFWVASNSVGQTTVLWQNIYTLYQYKDPVYPNTIEGEPGCEATSLTVSGNQTSEPLRFATPLGFCTNWRISTNGGFSWGPTSTAAPNTWTNVWPGASFTGNWLVNVRRYAC